MVLLVKNIPAQKAACHVLRICYTRKLVKSQASRQFNFKFYHKWAKFQTTLLKKGQLESEILPAAWF